MDLSPVSVNQWDSENWSKLPPEALQTLTLTLSIPINANIYVRQLKGAMTNEVYQCSWDIAAQYCEGSDINAKGDKEEDTQRFKGDKSRNAVLVRVYGKGVENFFDREDEIRTFEAISNAGQGPRLLGLFATGRIEEFLHARTLTPQDLRHPNVSAMIAVKLREFHQLPIGGEHAPQIWKRLRDWLNEAINICSGENLAEFGLHNIRNEIEELENKSSTLNSEVGFCHNDLQYGNILMDNKDGSLTFIDYEYAAYNPVAYDLANHFCEMTADYHTDSPHVLDFSKYPDLQERQRFIREYLRSSDADVNQCQVEKLSSEVDFYGSTSHLLWGLWGLISVSRFPRSVGVFYATRAHLCELSAEEIRRIFQSVNISSVRNLTFFANFIFPASCQWHRFQLYRVCKAAIQKISSFKGNLCITAHLILLL